MAAFSAKFGAWCLRGVEGLVRRIFPDAPRVRPLELWDWLESERPRPRLLDARNEAEYQVSHLPGAERLDWSSDLDSIRRSASERPIVVYCAAGYRSAQWVRRLRRAGAREVYNLEGAIFAWANAGLPLERGGTAAFEVHPHSRWCAFLIRADRRWNGRECIDISGTPN